MQFVFEFAGLFPDADQEQLFDWLADVAADPTDDTLALAFADWLTESAGCEPTDIGGPLWILRDSAIAYDFAMDTTGRE